MWSLETGIVETAYRLGYNRNAILAGARLSEPRLVPSPIRNQLISLAHRPVLREQLQASDSSREPPRSDSETATKW